MPGIEVCVTVKRWAVAVFFCACASLDVSFWQGRQTSLKDFAEVQSVTSRLQQQDSHSSR